MRKWLGSRWVLAAALLVMGAVVWPCTCIYQAPCELFADAEVIFQGKVLRKEFRSDMPTGRPEKAMSLSEPYPSATTYFEVQKVFKGVVTGTVPVVGSGTNCDEDFVVGISYLVYARRLEGSGVLYTDFCMSNKQSRYAAEDLEYLRNRDSLKGGVVLGTVRGVSLTGDCESWDDIWLAGATVWVANDKVTRHAAVDDKGKFLIAGLAYGTYSVWVDPPINDCFGCVEWRDEDRRIWNVNVEPDRCTRIELERDFTGSIAGKVLGYRRDSEKESLSVYASSIDSKLGLRSTELNNDGSFKIRNLAPGRYLVGMSLEWGPKTWYPYNAWYYSGTGKRDEAMPITVGEWEAVQNIAMPMPPRLKARELQLQVCDPNGEPAAKYGYAFYSEHDPLGGHEFDALDVNGQARIQCFEGVQYYIIVSTYDKVERRDVEWLPVPWSWSGDDYFRINLGGY